MTTPRAAALRPPDRDALRAVLREVAGTSGLPIAFGGQVQPHLAASGRDAVRITELRGTRTAHLRGLAVVAGAGLGGRVLTEGRLHAVEDYGLARGITHDYDGPVLAEGLCTVVATPVLVHGTTRAVVYATLLAFGWDDSLPALPGSARAHHLTATEGAAWRAYDVSSPTLALIAGPEAKRV